MDSGAEIAANLDNLYEYMSRTLMDANLHTDVAKLDEVSGLMGEIKEAWAAVPPELRGARS